MIRPSVRHRGKLSIALYMPMVREHCGEHCELGCEIECKVKEAVKENGGSVNSSGLFLSSTSKNIVVLIASGVNKRAVLFIPSSTLNLDLAQLMDKGMLCKT